MNKIFRIVWNASLQVWQVAGEIGKGRKKTKCCTPNTVGQLIFAGALMLLSIEVFAADLPVNGTIISGQVTINQQANVMNITQSTNKAAVNWQSFDVGKNNTVNFIQPDASSAILNRVIGSDVSSIQGAINANGQVFLINPNGILFTPSAQVNVGALVASTLNISNEDFSAGNHVFAGDSSSAIINQGNIQTADGGYVAFIAAKIENIGNITANNGEVLMGAGAKVTLDMGGPVKLEVEQGAIDSLIANGGAIQADGGMVYLSAKAAGDLASSVINHTGIVEASSLSSVGGEIILEGDNISLAAGSELNATGATGGGDILVGGDWQGTGDMRQAVSVDMAATASIDASATQYGDGGKVVLWSDVANAESVTSVSGDITASAGAEGGNGGKVETSGYLLKTSGVSLDLTAEKGSGGLWLLDPTNITISGSATTAGATPLPNYESNVDSSNVLNSDIVNQLNSGTSVTIQTGSGGAQAGDITLASDIVTGNMAGDATLTLKAHRNIVVNSGVSIDATQNSNTNKLNITLHSDLEGGAVVSSASATAGAIQVNNGASIKSNGGDIVLGGGADIATGYAFATGSLGTGAGIQLTNVVVDSAGGDITMRGRGNHASGASVGVVLDTGTSITSGAGQINITGRSEAFLDSTSGLRNGIQIDNASITSTSTANDAITLSGQEGYSGGAVSASGGTGNDREGISLTNTNITAVGGVTFAADKQIYSNSTLTTSGSSDSLSITSYENDAFWDAFTWNGALNGSDFEGSNSIAGLTINGFSNLDGLTIGKASSTSNVALNSDISINGPINVYADNIDMNRNITIANADENILMKASGYIFLTGGFDLTTNGGDISLWSNTVNTTTGAENNEVDLRGNNTLSSNGGNIILAGGLDDGSNGGTANDGIADGYAYRGYNDAIFAADFGGSVVLDSSSATNGGDIIIRGSGYGEGVKSVGTLKIDSGTGTITIDGKSTQDNGVEFNGEAIAITTENTTSDAINITGTTTGTGKYGVVLGSGGTNSRNTLIQATGANGGITIAGTSADSIGLYGTERGVLQVLAESGDITLSGQNQAGSTGEADADFRNGVGDNNVLFYLGNRKDATVVNGVTSAVTGSSSNIKLQADFLSWGTNEPVINTTGTFTLESVSDSFSTLQHARTSWFTFTNIGGLTIGKSTNIQNVTINEDLSVSGDVNLYGKDINVDNTINASGALLAKASRHNSIDADITASSAKFWADSDKGGDGINLISASNITTNGGVLEFGNADTHASGFLVGGDVYFTSSSAQTLSTNGGDLTVHGETLLANANGLSINTTGGDITFDGSINSANLYTSVSDGDISWDQARTNARSGTYGSAIGDSYLVTIGSRLENAVAGKIADYEAAWIGAARNGSGAWSWVDGPESGQVFFQQTAGLGLGGTAVNGLYNNFNPNEPNNSGGNEWVGQFVGTEGKWNDLQGSNPNGVLKYVKETNLASSNIAINSGAGNITFTGDIGTSKAIGTLDITSTSDVTLPSAITTENIQTYNAAVKLANDTVLTTTNSDIIFNSTVDSFDALDPKNLTTNILADTDYYWVDWTSADATHVYGTITIGGKSITVTFEKAVGFQAAQTNGGTNYWTGRAGNAFNGSSPYLSSTVANGPTGGDIIQLSTGGTQTLTFSESIENLAFSVISMNGGDFEFNQDFDIESYTGLNGASPGYFGGGSMIKTTTVNGTYKVTDGGINASSDGGNSEPHGTLRFANSFSELTWQDVTETWHGFTVGVSGATADAGKVQFNANVGSTAKMGDIDINGALQTTADISAANSIDVSGFSSIGGDIATIDSQNYQSAIEITADMALSSSGLSGNSDITATATIDGAFNLSIDTQASSDTSIAGAIGSTTQLKNVTITSDTISLNGISVEDSTAISISNISESTISDDLSGTDVTFTKAGTGTLILTGNNTYTGDTTISNGTLAITTVTGLGTTAGITTVADGAILDIRGVSSVAENLTVEGGTVSTSTGTSSLTGDVALTKDSTFSVAGTALTVSGDVAGGFGIEKTASGTLTLSGNNTYTKSTTISDGTLTVISTLADTTDVSVASGATYDVDETDTIQSLSGAGTVNLAGTKTLTTGDSGNDTISGVIEGAGSFTKAGSGTLTLSGDNTYTGATAINAGELLIENDTPSFASSSISGAGNLVIQSQAGSFSAPFTPNTAGFNFASTLGGLTIGKSTNTANITLGSSTSIAGNIDIYGGDITLNNKLEATNSGVIKLSATGNITDGASGYLIADNLALLDGTITLDNASNTVTNLAASGTDAISFINSGVLNLSSIGATNGLTSTGAIGVATKSGNLTVSQNVSGTNIILNAGKDTAAGTATGGNIIISGSPTFTASTGNTVLYSGDISDSTGLTTLVGSGSGNFRYNSDEATTNFTNTLDATGVFAVYREQPSATGTISSATITYGAANPSFSLLSGGGLVNGDSASGFTIVGAANSSAGKLKANSYTVTASGLAALGYSVSGVTNGDLTVNKKDLSVTGLNASNKVYDTNTTASLTGTAVITALTGDTVTLGGAAAGVFADKNADTDKTVTVTGNTIIGVDAGNYNLLQQAGLTADISKADLAITGLTASDKVYDTNTTASLTGTAVITALIGDTVMLGGAAAGVFADKNVDTDKTVTVTGNTISGTDADNYNLIQHANLTADISKADLEVTGLSVSDKVYDTNTTASLTGTAAIAALGSDTVTLSGTATGAFADKNADTDKTITVTGNTISGTDADNYNLIQQTGLTADISKADLAVTGLSVSDKVYDTNTTALLTGTAAIAALGSDTVTLSGTATGAFVDKNADTNKAVTVTGNTISGTDADNYNLIQQTGLTADISKADLTVTGLSASDKVYDTNTTALLTGTAAIAALGSDTVTLSGTATGAFEDKNVDTDKTVTVTGNTINGTDADNYNLIQHANLTADISKADLAVTGLSARDKVYDASTVAGLTGMAAVTALGSDTVIISGTATGMFADKNADTGKTVTVTGNTISGSDAGNYNLVQQTGLAADITKADLNVIANDSAKFLIENDPSFTASYVGFVNGETVNELGGALSIVRVGSDTIAGTFEDVIQASGYSADNYAITYQAGDLTIVGSDQLLVSVTNAVDEYGNDTQYSVASAQYENNGTIYTLGTGGIVGSSVTINTDNLVVIDDGSGGSARFNLDPKSASLSTANKLAVGAYQLGISGNVTENSGNFNGAIVVVGTHQVNAKALTVNAADGISKVYDGTVGLNDLSVDLTGLVLNDQVTVTGSGEIASKNVGSGLNYTVSNLNLSNTDAGNYYLAGGSSFTGTNAEVTAKEINVAYEAVDKTYDGSSIATVLESTSDIIAGDTVTFTEIAAFVDKNVANDKAVNISNIAISGGDAGNYTLSKTTATARADITRLASVTWVGGATGNWFDPSNWAGGAVPDVSNVASVVIPQGVTVNFDTSGVQAPADATAAVNVDSIGVQGSLTQNSGALNVGSGGLMLESYAQTGGVLTVSGDVNLNDFAQSGGDILIAQNFTVSENFEQGSNGTLTVGGNAAITDIGGGLVVGNFDVGGTTSITSTDGDITQATGTSILIGGETTLTASNGNGRNFDITLDGANNDFQGVVMATGNNITLADINALEVALNASGNSVLTAGGDLNVGGITNNLTTTTTHGGETIFGASTIKGDLKVVSDGDVTQTGALSVKGNASILAGVNTITLNNPNNNFQNALITQGGQVFLSGSDYVDEVNTIIGSAVSKAKSFDANSLLASTSTSIELAGLDGNMSQNSSIRIVPIEKEMASSEDNSFAYSNDDAYDSSQVNIFMVDGGVRIPAQVLNTLSK